MSRASDLAKEPPPPADADSAGRSGHSDVTWFLLSIGICVVVAAIDVAAGTRVVLIALLLAGPLLAATRLGPGPTAAVAGVALGLALGSGVWNDFFGTVDHLGRLAAVLIGGGLSVLAAAVRQRAVRDRTRLAFLADATRRMADATGTVGLLLSVGDAACGRLADGAVIDVAARGAERHVTGAVPPVVTGAGPGGIGDAVHAALEAGQPTATAPGRAFRFPGRDHDVARLTVPVLVFTRPAAAITLVRAGRAFDAEECAAVRRMAGRAGLMLENEQLEDELERAAAQLDTFFQSAPVGLAYFDRDLRFVRVNEQLATFNGLARDSHLGRVLTDVLPNFDPKLADLLRRAVTEGTVTTNVEVLGESAAQDDAEIAFSVSYYPVRGPTGAILGAGTIVVDRTQEFQAERERGRFLQALEEERQRLATVAEVGRMLDRTLDVEQRLAELSRFLVPRLGDMCNVQVLAEDGSVAATAVAATDPDVEATLREIVERFPLDLAGQNPLAVAFRTGEPVVAHPADDAAVAAAAQNAEHARLMRRARAVSGIAVPMVARGAMLGAIGLGSLTARDYDGQDLELLQIVAGRAGLAVDDARRYEEQHGVAAALQQALLPPVLPDWPGIELASVYRPAAGAAEVGGDFYDLFGVEGGSVIVIGDVSGKGPEAAALTAVIRHATRVAARTLEDADDIVAEVNRTLLESYPEGQFCTLAYVMLCEADGGIDLKVTCAGHPPVIVLRADGSVDEVGHPGTLIGHFDHIVVERQETRLERGDTVIAYTDGLTEARAGTRVVETGALHVAVKACAGLAPAQTVVRVAQEIDSVAGPARDDLAIVVAKVST